MGGFDAYTTDDNGTRAVPADRAAWDEWVSASRTRNWCKHDPLLDWLHVHGDAKGFGRDPEPDPRTDFQAFIFRQGHAFEDAVLRHLERLESVRRLEGGVERMTSLEACRETFEAMVEGAPIIYQGVLWNPENRSYGAPDLLFRSDVLRRLFPDAIAEGEAAAGAPGIGAATWHYRVVDVKFTGLKLDKNWHAKTDHLAYMAQVFVYNEALGRIQGSVPPQAFLLGRGWEKGVNDTGSTSCLDRLAPVSHSYLYRGQPLRDLVGEALAWVRRVRTEGHEWDPRSSSRPPELRPNPATDQSYPWRKAIAALANELEDVTLAWQVGLPGRDAASAQGIERWTDPRFSAAVAEVKGTRAVVLDRILDLNRDPNGPAVWPERISTATDTWGKPGGVEFYVDFETVSSLDDDFTKIPKQNGAPAIFMVGCGHVEDGAWQFACFIADDLTAESEAVVIEGWLAHMEAVRQRLAPAVERPLVFHWSPAETSNLSGALKSARARNPEREEAWVEPNWFDFLGEVIRKEPVVVRGPMGFGLKTVARSLRGHGLIDTDWPDGVADGLGAMVAAWWCAAEAKKDGARFSDMELMADVRAYNEVDCKVMMETVRFLRGRVKHEG
jgi:hypothetical protein